MLLHHDLPWAVNETSQFMRLCYLSYMPHAPPIPPVSAHIKVSTFVQHIRDFLYQRVLGHMYAGPGQFTNRLLILLIDVKGKDSMILFKIKETALFNSGHVLFPDLGSHVVALTQENVHDTFS